VSLHEPLEAPVASPEVESSSLSQPEEAPFAWPWAAALAAARLAELGAFPLLREQRQPEG